MTKSTRFQIGEEGGEGGGASVFFPLSVDPYYCLNLKNITFFLYAYVLQPFCSLTGYTHEMYVDPQREIYKRLGMKRGEGNNVSGKNNFLSCLDLTQNKARTL